MFSLNVELRLHPTTDTCLHFWRLESRRRHLEELPRPFQCRSRVILLCPLPSRVGRAEHVEEPIQSKHESTSFLPTTASVAHECEYHDEVLGDATPVPKPRVVSAEERTTV
jgi:hypothetical protein